MREEEVVQKYICQRMPGTGNWVFNHPTFQAWLNPRGPSCLWLSGAAGAGKSILCATILNGLRRQRIPSSTFISCFSNTDVGSTDCLRNILRVIISQLMQQQEPPLHASKLSSLLMDLEQYMHPIPPADFRYQLRKILNSLDAKQNIVFVVDDFDSNEWARLTFIDEIIQANIYRSKLNTVKCLLASRTTFLNTENSSQLMSIDMSEEPGVLSDVFHFAMKNVAVLPSISIEQSHVLEVSHRLCYRANGIFLWVVLALEDLQNSCELLETVDDIPYGIEGIYERRLRLITAQDGPTAHKILSWLAVAYKSLSVSELSEALAIEDPKRLDLGYPARLGTNDGQTFTKSDLYRTCGSLITVTEEGIVNFRHSSVRRFLLSGGGLVPSRPGTQDSHELVAQACLSLLGSDVEESLILLSPDRCETEALVREPVSSLFRYVARYWSAHFRLVERRSRSLNTMVQYLFERALRRACEKAVVPEPLRSTRVLRTALLHLYAYYGFSSLARIYLETGIDPNDRSCVFCETPMNIATTRGNGEYVALLLKKGASVHACTDETAETPLHRACAYGSSGTARLLLRQDIDTCNLSDAFGNTPLHLAATSGNLELIKLLIDHGADVNVVSKATNETPLHLAASHGHQLTVIALLDGRSASPTAVDIYGSIVQKPYFQTWSEDFLQHGEHGAFVWEADARDSAERDLQSLLLLPKQYADTSVRNHNGRTALQEAARCGHEVVVRILLDGDDNFTGGKRAQFDALQLAAEYGHLSVVKLLLKRGACNYTDSKDWGALIERVFVNGHQAIANLLIWQAFGSEIAGASLKWPIVSLAQGSRHSIVQEFPHRKRTQGEKKKSAMKRSGSGASERRTSYRLPFRSRNS